MDLTFLLNVLLRFAHLAGAIVVLGGLFRAHISGMHVVNRYRGWLGVGAVALLLSGAWQFMHGLAGAPRGWHIVIGLKILLGLHLITTSLLIGRQMEEERRERMARWAVISGWIVVLLAAVARSLR